MESNEKSGFIYVLTNESFHRDNWIKIGYAEDVEKRVKELSGTSVPFVLQDKSDESRPDATITQESFKLVVETKMTDWFHNDQLIHHLSAFKDEKYKVLITLSSTYMNDKNKSEL